MDLERLNKALSTYDVAEHIFKIDDGKTLSDCLKIVVEGQDHDPSTIAGAMKITRTKQLEALQPTPSWKPKTITVGGNKTKTIFNGVSAKPDAPVKKFNSIVNKSTSEFSRLTAEDHIDNHRSANGELPWKKRNVSADQVATVKRAVLKSVAAQAGGFKGHFTVNETAMAILRRARDLKENNNTPASKTIVAHGATSAQAVAAALPKAWTDSDDAPVMSVTDVDTRSALPDEFKPKITPTRDASFVARTKAARTLDRGKNMEVPNPETNAQGEVADKYWPHPTPNVEGPKNGKSIGAQTQKDHPNQEKQGFPKKDIEWDSIEAGRGYY